MSNVRTKIYSVRAIVESKRPDSEQTGYRTEYVFGNRILKKRRQDQPGTQMRWTRTIAETTDNPE